MKGKPLKRLAGGGRSRTGLKPGADEMLVATGTRILKTRQSQPVDADWLPAYAPSDEKQHQANRHRRSKARDEQWRVGATQPIFTTGRVLVKCWPSAGGYNPKHINTIEQ
jgi:hypothetical protein